MTIDDEVRKSYQEVFMLCDIDVIRGALMGIKDRELHPTQMGDVWVLFPLTHQIRLGYECFLAKQREKGKKDEKIRSEILSYIDVMERTYREKRVRERGAGGDGDWITAEVFPGARRFFKKVMGTGREFQGICGISHWLDDFRGIEYFLLTDGYKGRE